MSASTRYNASSSRREEEELVSSSTKTTEQQPPNKFVSNTKRIPKNPKPAVKTYFAKITYGREETNRQNVTKTLKKYPNEKNLSQVKKQKENFESKYMESPRFSQDQQKRFEIQEMSNEAKSSTSEPSEDSPKNKEEQDAPKEIVSEQANTQKEEKKLHLYGRSKTDLQLNVQSADSRNVRLSRRDTARSGSLTGLMNRPISISSQLSVSAKNLQTNKKASYNPEEARRFMEMQKKQRKADTFKDPLIKSKMEKLEIKKRLEELKKSSRNLVSKNLQKKEKNIGRNKETQDKDIRTPRMQETMRSKEPIKNRVESFRGFRGLKLVPELPIGASETGRSKTESVKVMSNRSSRSLDIDLQPTVSPLLENHKRIGLLRKNETDTDISLASSRNYDFDKENQNLEALTKKLINISEGNKIIKDRNNSQRKELEEQEPKISKRDEEVQCSLEEVTNDENKKDINVPASTFSHNKIEENKDTITINTDLIKNETQKSHDLPYWLKPSATQIYPYNFIMAVRRKLEAIAQPTLMHKHTDDKQNQETSITVINNHLNQEKLKSVDALEEKQTVELSISHKSTFQEQNSLSQNIKIKKCEKKKKETLIGDQLKRNEEKTNQIKYLQESIKATDCGDSKHSVKTKFHEQRRDISSSKEKSGKSLSSDQSDFNQNSPKFKLPTNYKSMENLNSESNSNSNHSSISLQVPISNTLTEVSSLKTETRRNLTHSFSPLQSEGEVASLHSQSCSSPEKNLIAAQTDFEFVKPRAISPLSLENVDKLKIKSNVTDNGREIDFTQLLEDFNRSLSQVIEVNEQLKCTLDKSQQILSPHSLISSRKTDRQYSSNFELSTTFRETERSIQKTTENLRQQTREIIEMTQDKLLTLPHKSKEHERHKILVKSEVKQRSPDLNVKSLTNSSTATSDHNCDAPLPEPEVQTSSSSSAQSPAERLYEIENLKETLRHTIFLSKKKRMEKEEWQEKNREKRQVENQNANASSIKHDSVKQAELALPKEDRSQNNNENKSLRVGNELEKYNKCNEQCRNPSKRENNGNIKKPNSEQQSQTQILHSNKLQRNTEKISKNAPDTNEISQHKATLRNLNDDSSLLQNYSGTSDNFSSNGYLRNHSNQQQKKSASSQILQNSNCNSNECYSYPENQVNGAELESHGSSPNQFENTARTRDTIKTETALKTNEDAVLSSSAAEEIEKTHESGSYDNENMPLNSNIKTKATNNCNNEHNDNILFIKSSHINYSRGDFIENQSKATEFHEAQFQQAIESGASQISSTEFANSADDEVTSSIASKSRHKIAINLPNPKTILSTLSPSKTNRRISISSDIVKLFSKSDAEVSEADNKVKASKTLALTNNSMSESSFNYSNVGLYDKLIQSETTKSQHLTALLKMREKALMDRTKGQIAWLEVQKASYKAKGLVNNIATIRKKQRGILLKMEKEREEIKRLLYATTTNNKITATLSPHAGSHKTNSHHNSPTKYKREKLLSSTPPLKRPKALGEQKTTGTENGLNASCILRATYKLESSRALEELLKKREDDLKKRREHVERLLQWHQRLDEEEAEVLNLERQLLSFNNATPHILEKQQSKLPSESISTSTEKLTSSSTVITKSANEQAQASTSNSSERKRASRARKMEKRLKEIDKSLKELSHISASSTTLGVMGQTNNEKDSTVAQEVDFVRTTGLKLNKLWKRLTSQQIEKFDSSRRYKLCKTDLERLYEEAKMAVLRDFAEDEERIAKELLEKSVSNLSSTTSIAGQGDFPTIVPMLNLNLVHSEAEEQESKNSTRVNAQQQGNYSPSVAEENFKVQTVVNSSASSETISEQQQLPGEGKQSSRFENNVQMFLALSQRIQTSERPLQSSSACCVMEESGYGRLQRSLSDTEISDGPKFKSDKTTTSQRNIATTASHSNSSISAISSARSSDTAEQHQRSKSSIVEITYIPSTQTETQTIYTEPKHTDSRKDLKNDNQSTSLPTNNSRLSVICSVGAAVPIKSSEQTSSDINTITPDSKSSRESQSSKLKSTYSGQISTDSEAKAKEISSKLEEISAAVTQLSQINALPSYESVTFSYSKQKSNAPTTNVIDETNSSTDSSSYSFNFENITIDKHSSPGRPTQSHTLHHKTIASQAYTKTDDGEHNNEIKESSSTTTVHSYSSGSSSLNSIKSHTYLKNNALTSSSTLTQTALATAGALDTYETDFETDLSNLTRIEDITMPTFEITIETSQDEGDVETPKKSTSKTDPVENGGLRISDKTYNIEELNSSKSLSGNEKTVSQSDFKCHKHSPDKELLPPPPPLPLPPSPPPSVPSATAATSVAAISTTSASQAGGDYRMPDIINELELRRHQLLLDNEHLKQYEHVTAVPYMYVREIPNKPPPPYVPPAHGSPMTTIFPSEDRIKDITFRRTHELYCELLKTEYCNENGEKLPSVMEERITNIYERIILDICREYLEEHPEILEEGDPTNFHSQLAFFNPPNRLRCIQDAIYKEVRTCLAMNKNQPKRTQIYSVYGQRAKQDHIGKIIIQEMCDEDDLWCNFHREESEVLHLIIEEMISKHLAEIAKDVWLEEGGIIDEEEERLVEENEEEEIIIGEENQANHQIEDEEFIDEKNKQHKPQFETSSVLVETISEGDQTYCVNEDAQKYTLLNQSARIESDHQGSVTVKSANIVTTANAVQTCT